MGETTYVGLPSSPETAFYKLEELLAGQDSVIMMADNTSDGTLIVQREFTQDAEVITVRTEYVEGPLADPEKAVLKGKLDLRFTRSLETETSLNASAYNPISPYKMEYRDSSTEWTSFGFNGQNDYYCFCDDSFSRESILKKAARLFHPEVKDVYQRCKC